MSESHDADVRQVLVERMIAEQARLKAVSEAATHRKLALLERLERSLSRNAPATLRARFTRLWLPGKRRRG
jgi:hypothetical protein